MVATPTMLRRVGFSCSALGQPPLNASKRSDGLRPLFPRAWNEATDKVRIVSVILRKLGLSSFCPPKCPLGLSSLHLPQPQLMCQCRETTRGTPVTEASHLRQKADPFRRVASIPTEGGRLEDRVLLVLADDLEREAAMLEEPNLASDADATSQLHGTSRSRRPRR